MLMFMQMFDVAHVSDAIDNVDLCDVASAFASDAVVHNAVMWISHNVGINNSIWVMLMWLFVYDC